MISDFPFDFYMEIFINLENTKKHSVLHIQFNFKVIHHCNYKVCSRACFNNHT